tara:strand:+ start:549 stop:1160 length:612 start_codon:yes stop_codon:yes gene_type:complete
MNEMRKEMEPTYESDYKVGIMAQWSLKKEVTDDFLSEIWEASTGILSGLEVQVVIDSSDRLHISSGTAGYVDFKINPVGMKLPIKCWIHTHPFGQAYWSGIDWRTINTWRPMMKKAIVLGNNQRGIWYNTLKGKNWIWEDSDGVQLMKGVDTIRPTLVLKPQPCLDCLDQERLREILLDYDFITEHELINAEELLRLEQGEEV